MADQKKFLDYEGVKYLWSKINMQDYPNNETLMDVIEAIDETKADKSELVQSDWNQNDETQIDYIKNRPFYEIPEIWATLDVINNGGERFYLDYLLELDKPYTVRVDGVVYSFDCLKKGEYHSPSGFYPWYIGAKYHPIYTINWDYPFTIFSMGSSGPREETYIMFEDGSSDHTVEFFESEGEIHYIDPKYIKDMYYEENIEVDISGKTYTINVNDMPAHNQAIPLALGQVWTSRRCHYSGGWAEYLTFEVRQTDDGTCYLGSPTLMDDEGYSVIYLTANELKTPSGMVSQGYRAFEFTCVSGKAVIDTKIHHIDPKYIKDMYYETEPLETEILPEFTLESTEDDYVVAEDFLETMLQEGKTYLVTWNGEKYIRKAKTDTFGEVYIGNQSIAINGAGAPEEIFDKLIDSSEPFFIVSYEPDAFSLVVAESGSHTFSISIIEQDIHQIPSKYVGTDWNQSSHDGVGYINNRPFYDDMVYKLKTEDEVIDILNDAGYSINSTSPELIEDITFRVVVDGRVYDNVPVHLGCYVAGSYTFGIGDLYQSNPSGNNWQTTNYGFCYSGFGTQFNSDFFPNGVENIEIYSVERELKQIDPKYLPILEENFEIVFEANDITDSQYEISDNPKYKKLLGKYRITIDGTSEILEFIDTPDDFSWIECDLGYIETWNGGIHCDFYSDNESHSVKIESIKHIINPKYIKDMYYEIDKSIQLSIVESTGHAIGYTSHKVGPYAWDIDKELTICVDGVTYIFNGFTNDGYNSTLGMYRYRIGAPYALGSITDSSEYPFVIIVFMRTIAEGVEEYAHIEFADGTDNHTVKIPLIEIKTIDEKYIPDTIARVEDVADQIYDALQNSVADWNQNDETAPDFIKNKPDVILRSEIEEIDAIKLVTETGLVSPAAAEDGAIYTDENGALYSL